jgi:hypothetical protein
VTECDYEKPLRPYYRDNHDGRGQQRLVHPSAFFAFGRTVMGLWLMGMNDPYEMASVMSRHPATVSSLKRKVRRFLKLLTSSSHPIMEAIRYNGLPRGCGASLPEGRSVACPLCRRKVNVVPCVHCTPSELDEKFPVGVECALDQPLLPAEEPTFALPGSAEKIEVMRQRVARGQSCFHPLDPVVH